MQGALQETLLGGTLQAPACAAPRPRHTIASPRDPEGAAPLPPAHVPPPAHPPRHPAAAGILAALLAAIAVLVLAACGSQGSGTAADPATAVPAGIPLYAGATVRPSGAEKDAALASGRALTHRSNPYLPLVAILQTPGSPALDYKRDVSPWLGQRAGIFLASLRSAGPLLSLLQGGLLGGASSAAFPFGPGGAQGAIVMDTSDAGRARTFLNGQARRAGAHGASYRGVAYEVTGSGVAFGLVDRFAVVGTETGLKGVVDTIRGGPALARASGYSKLAAAAPQQVLAHVYYDPSAPGAAGGASGVLALLTGGRQANLSLVPAATSIAVDVDTLPSISGSGTGLLVPSAEAADALSRLPGESWLAAGLPSPGASLGNGIKGLRELISLAAPSGGESAGVGTISVGSLLGALTAPLDALAAGSSAWMGPVGIFASGTGLLELRGAVVIDSKDPAASRAAVGKLAAALRRSGAAPQKVSIPGADAAVGVRLQGLPLVLAIADGRSSSGRTELVLGLGEPSVAAALNPASTLASSAARSAAAGTLGEGIQPSVIVNFPTLLGLLEGVGLSEDPSLTGVLPYLRSLTTLAGGGRQLSGGVERFRLVLGLRQSG